jgi:phosphoribosylaminoimidazole-succinocarboxamide synthase
MSGGLTYEGKAKRLWATEDPDELVMEFKDDATAFNGQKRGQIADKGVVNARLTAELFRLLEREGIPTCLRRQLDDRRLVVTALKMIPLEVVVRNVVAGSLAQRTGLAEGTPVPGAPLVELYYKSDALGDPLLNDEHVALLGAADAATLTALKESARRVNGVLAAFFQACGLTLVDFKLEYGWGGDRLIVADEISPDTCRLWDTETGERLDKDRFRRDLGGAEDAYQDVLRRVLRHAPA